MAFGALMRAIDGGTVTTNHWQAKQAQIVMLHNGHAKIGGVIVNNRGELVMMQNSVNESFVIKNNALTPFVQATGGTSQAGVANNTMQTVYSGTPVQLPNTLNVTQSGSTIRFTALLRAQHEQGINTTTIIGASIRAELYRGNVFYAMLGMVGVANGTSERNIDMQIRNVEQGVYNVRVTYEKDPTSQGFGHIGASELSYNFTAGSIKRTELANNGFMSVMRDGHIYFAERLGLDLKGATNMPGVLLSASVGTNGGFAHSWGAKKHPAQAAIKNSVGRYTVYHDIGHTSYHVNATPSSANKSCHIVDKYSTYFIIEWRTIGSVSSLADTAFDFQITGDNYTPSVVKDESGRT